MRFTRWVVCRVACSAILLHALAAVPADASLITFSGAVTPIAAPADARLNQLESNTLAPLFTEVTNLILLSALTVDVTAPGTYSSDPATTGSIPAGTAVDSYYLITDPVGADPDNNRNFVGSMTFSTDVLGVIVLDPRFASSNAIVGHPGTLYSAAGIALELGLPDVFTLSADRRNLSFNMTSAPAADNIRVITSSTLVPEPATWIMITTGLVGIVRRRRGSARNKSS